MTKREEFRGLVTKYIKRDGITELLDMLDRTDFYTAPASTRFHDACEEGLVAHSISVFNWLAKDFHRNLDLTEEKQMETIAIVSLFHDFCKIGFYATEMRNTKDERGQWIKVPYYTVNDLFPYGHGEKSVYMIQKYISLTDEEAMAIRWHMGGYEPDNNYNYLSGAYSMFPLIMYLFFADMKASYLEGTR